MIPWSGGNFRHFILQECWAYSHYSKIDFPMTFWRTASGAEVDLLLGDADAAVEIKSSENVGDRPKGLHLFVEETKCRKAFIVSRELLPRKLDSNITVLPWQTFCEILWAGKII